MKIEETFQAKIQKLQPWFSKLVFEIKKDVKGELFTKYPKIYQRHFSKTYFAKLPFEELAAPLLKEVLAGDENLAEWICSLWVVKNEEMYNFFAQRLILINPDFEKIETLTEAQGESLMKDGVAQFGPVKTYLFSILNSVAFPETILNKMATLASNG